MSFENDIATQVETLLNTITGSARPDSEKRQILRLLNAATQLVSGDSSSLDIKIASMALQEMTKAFEMFAPYREAKKVTIFGSARTTPDNPIYALTVNTAKALAEAGYMVVTGAGPGLMEAGMLGAGRENSIGVSIRLPFESGANSVIAGDEKYVSMRYFFTRKLMLVKESHAFLCMPGGFGTLDETFELLTLAQTAKSVPVPIVFLEVPGDPFWSPLMTTMESLLNNHGLISPSDTSLYRITDNITTAVSEITNFYYNYHSIRFVKDRLYIRMRREIPAEDFALLTQRFQHLSVDATMDQPSPTPEEIADLDNLELFRISFYYAGKGFADLRPLIDSINRY
jgi:uncharacterized protein (TIGR00730 family)